MKKKAAFIIAGLAAAVLSAQQPDPFKEFPEKYWDFPTVCKVPAFREAPEKHQVKGLKAVLVDGFGPKADDKKFDDAFPKPLSEKTKAEFSETLIDWMVNQSEVFLDIDTVSQIIIKIKEMINERP